MFLWYEAWCAALRDLSKLNVCVVSSSIQIRVLFSEHMQLRYVGFMLFVSQFFISGTCTLSSCYKVLWRCLAMICFWWWLLLVLSVTQYFCCTKSSRRERYSAEKPKPSIDAEMLWLSLSAFVFGIWFENHTNFVFTFAQLVSYHFNLQCQNFP